MNPATNTQRAQPNITPMYPGIQQSETDDGPDLPKAPLNTLLGFTADERMDGGTDDTKE